MNEKPKQLSARQRAAIEALLTHGEVTAAATACGVSRQTIHSWMREPAFQAALTTAEAEVLRGVTRRLVALGDAAVSTIADVMADPDTSPSVRLKAADSALSHLLRLREMIDIETRVAALEAAVLAAEESKGVPTS